MILSSFFPVGNTIKNWPGCSRVAVEETDSYRLLLISEHTILVSRVDLQFHWDEVEASERQTDGSLFSWFEHHCCYRHIIYGIVNTSTSTVIVKSDGNDLHWEPGKPLLHRSLWALKKKCSLCMIASYFAFLGMYTRWMLFPAAFGLTVQLVFWVIAVVCPFCFILKHNFLICVNFPNSGHVKTRRFLSGDTFNMIILFMNYPAGVDDESKFLEVNGISFSPPWLMDKIPRHDPLIGVQLNVNNPGCLTFKSPSSAA
ncbi:hypothetical protein H5410_018904 [Solanum commersonii]|uniref:Anoctamin transmembrane domain-containing protein n=1 Tax=Solanum commersonii TaxID=4109 RepID=A0A9J6A3U6_SOLCO|nr:hypothetical protein H5410_018904 [Solanum commersonii]